MDHRIVHSQNRFAFQLFADLVQRAPGKNVFISPVSVMLALAMTYNGAAGETQREMARALELDRMRLDEVNQASAELLRSLGGGHAQARLAIANSLWVRKGIALAPDFLRRGKEFYQAQIEGLDFADPRAPATINGWVRHNTNGKIEKIVDQIDPSAILFLLNAIYFKGTWTRQFDQRQTSAGTFHLPGGRKQHPLMAQSGEYDYYAERDFQAIGLPYGDQRLSMYIFLPSQQSSLDDFQQSLSQQRWSDWMRKLRRTEGRIVLPRFKLEYEVKLNEPLKALGMASAFDPRRADFSGMRAAPGPAISIDEVKHKTFVEVNEEGTEAAAVTSVGMVLASFTPKRTFSMVVDRPFFCAIRDSQSEALLFMGSIVDP